MRVKKTYELGGFLGKVQTSRARSTGSTISIYHAEQAGFCADGGGWVTFCENHSCLINHESLKLARQWVPHPEEWCGECQKLWWAKTMEKVAVDFAASDPSFDS